MEMESIPQSRCCNLTLGVFLLDDPGKPRLDVSGVGLTDLGLDSCPDDTALELSIPDELIPDDSSGVLLESLKLSVGVWN